MKPPRPSRAFLLTLALLLASLRFLHLTADFPNHSPWAADQAKFTDEGWWAQAAILHHLTGHWTIPGDYNPAVALPVWPALLAALFHFTGVSLAAARALNVTLSLATVACLFALVRRYASTTAAAACAALLLLSSPLAFHFSRLATLDTAVLFEFTLALLLASHRRLLPLACTLTLMALTKTTSLALLPAIAFLAWRTDDAAFHNPPRSVLKATLATIAAPSAGVLAFYAAVAHSRFAADLHFFFAENGAPDIDWPHAAASVLVLLRHMLWTGPVLCWLALLALALSVTARRRLWSNPLWTSSTLAIAGQAAFLFSRQDDVAPRYFLLLLLPLILLLALTLDTLPRPAFLAPAAVFVLNLGTLTPSLLHPTYALAGAGQDIARHIAANPQQHAVLLGVSGPELSLLTRTPSLNDAFGTQPLATRIRQHQPGWALMWTGLAPEVRNALQPLQPTEVARYELFDDPDRHTLILYKLQPAP